MCAHVHVEIHRYDGLSTIAHARCENVRTRGSSDSSRAHALAPILSCCCWKSRGSIALLKSKRPQPHGARTMRKELNEVGGPLSCVRTAVQALRVLPNDGHRISHNVSRDPLPPPHPFRRARHNDIVEHMYAPTRTYMCTYTMYTYISMYKCMHMHIHKDKHKHKHERLHTHVHGHVHIQIHTHTHTQKHAGKAS